MTALDPSLLDSLGADLRSLRKSRGLTLSDLAEAVGKSVGWLSQVERDLSEPSINDLRDLAKALDIPMSMLFGQAKSAPEEAGFVVRQVQDVRLDQTRRDLSKSSYRQTLPMILKWSIPRSSQAPS